MNLMKRIILLLCFLVPAVASAQFYVTGDDPGRLRWNYMDTESFRVIYPQGCDSLAKTYDQEVVDVIMKAGREANKYWK